MAREEWKKEIDDAKRREAWDMRGRGRPAKIMARRPVDPIEIGGFFTKAGYLSGHKLADLQRDLGLPGDIFADGATLCCLARLPLTTEYEFELTAKYPDGLAYVPFMSDERYMPGSDKILQWRLGEGKKVRADLATVIHVPAGGTVPRDWPAL